MGGWGATSTLSVVAAVSLLTGCSGSSRTRGSSTPSSSTAAVPYSIPAEQHGGPNAFLRELKARVGNVFGNDRAAIVAVQDDVEA